MNDDILLGIACTLGAVFVLWLVVFFIITGGEFARYFQAKRVGKRYLSDQEFAAKVDALSAPPKPPEPVAPPKPSAEPLRLLSLLQREGRLLDFLLEDIHAYPNDQIGAAVRDIHKKCQATLKEHLQLAPVLTEPENANVEVPVGFDPSAIRLLGNVTGQPPFRGTLLHHGWRVTQIKLTPPAEGQDEFVVQPAEVELP